MKTMKMKFTGVSPIMFHNERLANPTHPMTRELKKLTLVKKKTDDVLEQIKWLEWRCGFYENDGVPVVPADNVLAVGLNGAKKMKLGRQFSAAVIETEPFFVLGHKGPKTIDKLEHDERFCDYRTVVVSQRRMMRARPIFREWWLQVGVQFDPELMQESEVLRSYEIGGEQIGLCERRPRYGRFLVERI